MSEKLTSDILLELVSGMPWKQINVRREGEEESRPYLQRFYAGTTDTGYDIWLHRFLSADGDRHLHNHPWTGYSVILTGSYVVEESLESAIHTKTRTASSLLASALVNELKNDPDKAFYLFTDAIVILNAEKITPFTWHRIASVEPETWTMMFVKRDRLPVWHFKEPDGALQTVNSSPRNWWDYINDSNRVVA